MRLWLCLLVACSWLSAVTQAHGAKPRFVPPRHGDVYLVTIDLGQQLYTRYGHTVLRIIDRDSGADYNFNWGIFDYRSQLAFGFVFFKGILTYRLGVSDYARIHSHYTRREKRDMSQNKVNLTEKQKTQLFNFIATNLRPENITYHYQYFFANCATIIRDYLDRVLHGKVREVYGTQMTAQTFRHYVRGNLNRPPIVVFALDLVMNSRIDYPLSKWQEMFYPLKLQQYLSELRAVDDTGNFTDEPLLEVEEVIHQDNPWLSSDTDSFVVFAGVALLLLLLSWLLYKRYHSRLLYSSLLLLWGLFAALLSIIMIVSWCYSGHLDLHHNANLWLFWPTDIIFCWLAVLILRRKDLRWPRLLQSYCLAHLAAWLLLASLRFFGIITQNVDTVLLYVSPLLVSFCLFGLSQTTTAAVQLRRVADNT